LKEVPSLKFYARFGFDREIGRATVAAMGFFDGQPVSANFTDFCLPASARSASLCNFMAGDNGARIARPAWLPRVSQRYSERLCQATEILMRFSKIVLRSAPILAAALATSIAGVANAEELLFTISGTGDPTTTFELPLNPTPDFETSGSTFGFYSVSATVNGSAVTLFDVKFYSSGSGGGLSDAAYYQLYGAQYYFGSESDPTFTPGVYTAQSNHDSGNSDTVTIADVPEPSSLVLVLAGFGILGMALRLRHRAGANIVA
jgi:hypothetical protein